MTMNAKCDATSCPSESMGFGACRGTLIKYAPDEEFPRGLSECSHCGLTPYTATERVRDR